MKTSPPSETDPARQLSPLLLPVPSHAASVTMGPSSPKPVPAARLQAVSPVVPSRHGRQGGALVMAGLLAAATPGFAKPEYREALFTAYPSAVGTRLDSLPSRAGHCGVCHYRFQGGGERNLYGSQVENAIKSFPKTAAGYRDAILSISGLDADTDGFSTLLEVTATTYANVPTFPGLNAANLLQVSGISSADITLIQGHLTPASTADITAPAVSSVTPSGGSRTANTNTAITWTATDAGGIAGVNVYLSLDNGTSWSPIALGLPNAGSYPWFPANRPTTQARVRVVAIDNAGNRGTNQSPSAFAIVSPAGGRVPTTLRDFDMPGTQPHELTTAIAPPSDCAACHGNYDTAAEPWFNWQGSMMAHASIDPLFEANLAIANQDAPDSGDLCLRCHIYPGWVQGRSVPTSGTAMLASDKTGVSCDLCHRLVDPVFKPGVSPASDQAILAALTFPGTNIGNGMLIVDPAASRRGPFTNAALAHEALASPFHRSAALCGTCHDVSNPALERAADGTGPYAPNTLNATAATFSPHRLGPVERTYSEWFNSAYNSTGGVYAPQFAGNKADGRVATCQDCHMRDVAGRGANPAQYPAAPVRPDLPSHDMTGSSTWLPALLPARHPGQINGAAITAGVARATALLRQAATLGVQATSDTLTVAVTNQTGHKLPTGYPEGRRMWIEVKVYDAASQLLAQSAAYDPATGVLTRDDQARIYEMHPGIDTNLSSVLGLPIGPSLHFVLNNRIFEDNRIPPRGFSNATFAAFGGAPVGHDYADGQHWDLASYPLPPTATRAEVRLLFQSTSKEFVEFLRDENRTNTKGQEMYDLWNNNGKCPPTQMAEATWLVAFRLVQVRALAPGGAMRIEFLGRPGTTYTIEYSDKLGPAAVWKTFAANGSVTLAGKNGVFTDDFTAATSGTRPPNGARFYRFRYPAN